jgi:Na+-translocating ferredoxin:NAD+ oxidoreductase RnfG subunit
MLSRRRFVAGAAGAWLVVMPSSASAQEGVFLRPEEAPRHLFPDASDVKDQTVAATPLLQQRVRDLLGRASTLWEQAYRIFTVKRGDTVAGFVVVVEEIGKHRPITFAVAVNPDGSVHDVAVLAYREAYGGEVRERRFLKQYAGKTLADPLLPYRDIRNIAGATLSVEATGRAVRKAVAVLKAAGQLS